MPFDKRSFTALGDTPGSGGQFIVDYLEAANEAARFALTAPDDIQEGDLVQQLDDETWWRLEDDSNIGNAAGWREHFSNQLTTLQDAFNNGLPLPLACERTAGQTGYSVAQI